MLIQRPGPRIFNSEFTDTILDIIERYELGSCVRFILRSNPSLTLPYHNFNHSLWVLFYTFRAAIYSDIPFTRAMAVAALFHDYGHLGGVAETDADNIEQAVIGYKNFVDWEIDLRGTDPDAEEIIRLIHGTQFPYEVDPADDALNCLRDADLMQNCNDTLFDNQVGIKQESCKDGIWDDYLDGTLKFLGSVKYRTKYGQEDGTDLLRDAIDTLRDFKSLCFDNV